MAKKIIEQKYRNKDGYVLLESTKFEYEINTFHLKPGAFYLADSKIEKHDTEKNFKREITKGKDAIIKIEKLLVAAPPKWLEKNEYEKI